MKHPLWDQQMPSEEPPHIIALADAIKECEPVRKYMHSRPQGIIDMRMPARITPVNFLDTLLVAMVNMAIVFNESEGSAGELFKIDEMRTVYRLLVQQFECILGGSMGVLFLTAGQQQALEYSDPPDDEMLGSIEPPFPDGVMVVLADPPSFTKGNDGEGAPVFAALYPPEFIGCSMMTVWGWGDDAGRRVPFMFPYVSWSDTAPTTNWIVGNHEHRVTEDSPQEVRDAWETLLMLKSIGAAAMMFGVTDVEPVSMRPRNNVERKQRERDLARANRPNTVAIRYLRDPHNTIAVERREGTETGRHVRPHWRRGHFRNVRYGPMSEEHRPTRPVYVPPVLINSHLGTPSRSVYRW